MTTTDSELRTNYVSKLPAGHYASLYRVHELHGAHVIMLGPGNDEAAKEACRAWPGGLQVGGGITDARYINRSSIFHRFITVYAPFS